MLKYFRDRGGDQHGGQLHWPGTPDGFPFRGNVVPDLRDDEIYNVPLALDFHSNTFRLWKPEEKFDYDIIQDRICNGWYMEKRRIDRWSDEHCGLVVYLEWVQIYGETPTGKNPGPINETYEKLPQLGPFSTWAADQNS